MKHSKYHWVQLSDLKVIEESMSEDQRDIIEQGIFAEYIREHDTLLAPYTPSGPEVPKTAVVWSLLSLYHYMEYQIMKRQLSCLSWGQSEFRQFLRNG